MRVVYIAAGAGNMYCGACARDLALIRALLARGHAVATYPLYMPLRMDGAAIPTQPVAFGGVRLYLRQALPALRLPAALGRLLDAPRLLQWVSRFAVSSKAEALGPLTVSVLEGGDGATRAALEELLTVLEADTRPDLVNLTNSLLSGIAPAVKARLDVPVVCNVQGEELFVAALPEPHRSRATALLRANAAAVDLFLAPSDTYARAMAAYLQVPDDRMRVAHPGVDLDAYHPAAVPPLAPLTIGYLSVITPGKGLDLLVEAVVLLRARGRDVRLRIAGATLDAPYGARVQRRIDQAGLRPHTTCLGEVNFAEKLVFLQGCTAFSVPGRAPESRAIALLEAMACGVPVVMPAHGICPEIHALTGAGRLCPPENPMALADALDAVVTDPATAHAQARAALPRLAACYSAQRMADDVLAAYTALATTTVP